VESVNRRHVEQPSVTGRSTVPMNDPVYNQMSGYYGIPPAIHNQHHTRDTAPNHNQVDIMRIRLGLDVRTTVCLYFPYALCLLTSISDHVAKHSQ
jgi:hypothetical protein